MRDAEYLVELWSEDHGATRARLRRTWFQTDSANIEVDLSC